MENNEKLDIDPLYRAIMPVCFGSGPFIICDDSNCHDACNGENARLREVTIQKRARNSFCCALCGKTNDTPICPKCAGNELIVPRFTPSGRICSLCMNPTTISICPSCADKQKPDARADALAAWSRIKDKIVTQDGVLGDVDVSDIEYMDKFLYPRLFKQDKKTRRIPDG